MTDHQTTALSSCGLCRGDQRAPTIGTEIQKTRPCLIVSPPEMHDHLRSVILAPMTTGSRPAGFRVPLSFKGKEGLVLLDQIRTVDKQRLIKRLGAVTDATLATTFDTLREVFQF